MLKCPDPYCSRDLKAMLWSPEQGTCFRSSGKHLPSNPKTRFCLNECLELQCQPVSPKKPLGSLCLSQTLSCLPSEPHGHLGYVSTRISLSFPSPVSCFTVVSCSKKQTWQPSEIFFFFNKRWALTQYTDRLKAQLLLDTRAASEKALDGPLLVRVLQQRLRAMVGGVFLGMIFLN